MRYAPLHNHSVYSIKDAINTPKDYVKAIHKYNIENKENEIVGFAITEHNNLFSLVEHHIACTVPMDMGNEKKTLKPIYGNEIYHKDESDKFRYHLVILAKNNDGLETLIELSSHCGLNKISTGVKDYHICKTDDLKKFGKGLIALTACLGGKLGQLVVNGMENEANEFVLFLKDIFEEVYLEIQPHDIPEQKLLNNYILNNYKKLGVDIVITSDSHYVYKYDRESHDVIKIIDSLSRKEVEIRKYTFNTANHLWTVEELKDWCLKNNVPLSAIENTAKISDKCTADATPRNINELMPEFKCPFGFTPNTFLKKMAFLGMKKKFKLNKNMENLNAYIERLNYELGVINQKDGFSSYFLILWDWFSWCSKNNIPLGPGRGSAAGSLVAYFLGITKVDPIKYNLMFERFITVHRVEMPDRS